MQPDDFDNESPAERMKRIQKTMRSPDVEIGSQGQFKSIPGVGIGYSGVLGGSRGPLSAMGAVASNPRTDGVGALVGRGALQAGPVEFNYQRVQPAMRGARAENTIGLGGKPFDPDTYFGVQASQGPAGRGYGVNIGRDGFSLSGQYNPSRRDLSGSLEYRREFSGGGPVMPSFDPMGGFTGMEGVEQAARAPGMYEALANRMSSAGATVGEPLRQAAKGLADIPGSVGRYLAETSQKPDPSQRIAEDIRKVGGMFVDEATKGPLEFAKTVGGFLPVIGEGISAYDATQLYEDLKKAEAEGDTKKADTLRQFYGMAVAGATPGVGIAARIAGKVKRGAKAAEDAAEGAAEGAVKQSISSADTSLNQVPALFKSKYFETPEGTRNLDIGGGKYDKGTEYLAAEKGVDSYVVDPFNRTPEHNKMVLDDFAANPADTVTVANVLNVIKEPEARLGTIQQAYDNLKPGGKAYFDIYEGDKSGVGRETVKGWQNNMKAAEFAEEISSVFPDVQRKGTMLIATKPLDEAVEAAPPVAPSVASAAPEASTAIYQPVMQAFDETPDPAVLRDDIVGQITRSIDESDGAKAAVQNQQGLSSMYIVDSGITDFNKKDKFLLASTKNINAEKQLDGITPLLGEFPDMALNPEQWAQAMTKAWGSDKVLAPPYRFMKAMQDGEYENLLRGLTPGQIADADAGFANGKEFLRAYGSGQMNVEDTGKLFMWGILSRGVDPFTHEGLFLDAFDGIEQWLRMAADGQFTKEVAEGAYKDWAASVAPKGSGQAGSGAVHNLNAFGRDFLTKMSVPNADGVTPLQKLHDLMADPTKTGREIRREFAKTGEGVGIDNKVVSFILLATGRDDVMVIDRIQLKNLWDDGRYGDVNIWDGVSVPTVKLADGTVKRFPPTDEGRAAQEAFLADNPGSKREKAVVGGTMLAEATYGAKGILVYEALEDALMKNLAPIYERLGRPEAATPGRFHWETWVARSNQEASHGTLGSILSKAQGANDPLSGVYSKQGDYQKYAYGAKYGRGVEGSFYDYPLSTGEEVRLTPPQLKAALDIAKNPKYGVVPRGFSVEETVGRPWYEREGVNRARLDEIIRASASGQEVPVRKAFGGEVSDGARTRRGDGSSSKTVTDSEKLNSIERAIASFRDVADEHGVRKPQLTNIILKATPNMPRERAALFAGNILGEDILDLSERLVSNPKAIPLLKGLEAQIKKGKTDSLVGELRQALRARAINGG